jgi:pyruvate/2-oxoglutarate dehydrogenase complex dihydrolipoamide dehydrogenase (E3) component
MILRSPWMRGKVMKERADVVVVGMGPGGGGVGEGLAGAGLDVGGVERELVGGECPYWGCVPSKVITRAANLIAEGRRIPGVAGSAMVSPDWSLVATRIRREATDTWDDHVAAEGLEIRSGRRSVRVTAGDGRITVDLDDGSRVSGERILVATGRRPNIASVGLDSIGFDPAARSLDVDENCRLAPGMWAVGDCTGKGFTRASVCRSHIAVADILDKPHAPATYHRMPRVTFTDPEVGAVGLTERLARERELRVRTGIGWASASTRCSIHGPGNEGFIKLVEDADRRVLVGATSMGPVGGEVLSMFCVVVHAGVPTTTLREMIYAYPTFHRGVEGALAQLAA